jgi:hypothetical protein
MNDASILRDIFTNNPDLIEKIDSNRQDLCLQREGDILILDRGFRDVIELLEKEFKLQTKMPHFLEKDQKQFTSKQANESRLCTKIRWVVEAVNSLLKQKFRALDRNVQNKSLPHYILDFKIAGAMINRYFKRSLKNMACIENLNLKT